MQPTNPTDCVSEFFLGSELANPSPTEALFHILPVPFEKSVSYGCGTAAGPAAIIKASQQLELYDGTSVPAEYGIYTHPPLPCQGEAEKMLQTTAAGVGAILDLGKIPVLLGGEHTVTLGALQALKKKKADFGIVQFDAHADLRNSYENSPYSHACVMRRAYDLGIPMYQIGVRSLSYEEEIFRREKGIGHLDALDIARSGLPVEILPLDFPKKIYLTIDVDALDPGIMPATGTPEPGGLSWYQMLAALESVLQARQILGFDVVELAPIVGMHAPDFTVARLIYNLFGLIIRNNAGFKPPA